MTIEANLLTGLYIGFGLGVGVGIFLGGVLLYLIVSKTVVLPW